MIKIKHFNSFLVNLVFILTLLLLQFNTLEAQATYTISGVVISNNGRGIDGVTIEFNDGVSTPQYETTAGGGYYSHTVPSGWTGTVTPSHACYLFVPASASLGPITSDSSRDFTGTARTLTISGTITDNVIPVPNPIPGVVLTLSTGGSTTSAADGTYSLIVPCNWTGTVTPTMVGWEFSPQQHSYQGVVDNRTGQDFIGTQSNVEFIISGRITDDSGRVDMAGVEITFYDGQVVHTETTDSGGNYSYSVPIYWTGTVIPNLTGFSFSPTVANIGPIISNITQDFIAIRNIYTISGVVMNEKAKPIQGVIMSLSTGSSDTTNTLGQYEFQVTHGWSGNLTPSKNGWNFEPVYRSYVNINSNHMSEHFVGHRVKNKNTISGTVNFEGTGLANVALSGLPGNPVTSTSGFYSATIPQDWSGTVVPTLSGYAFIPSSRTYSKVKENLVNENYQALVNDPPQVLIVNPQDKAFVTGEVIVKVETSDSDGIGKVEIFIDNQKVAEYLNVQNQVLEIDPVDLFSALRNSRSAVQFDSQGNSYSIIIGQSGKIAVIRYNNSGYYENIFEAEILLIGWLVKPDGTVIVVGVTPKTGKNWIESFEPKREMSGMLNPWVDIRWILKLSEAKDREMNFSDIILNPALSIFTCKYLLDTSLYEQGSHTIMARAFDTKDLSSEDEVEFTISSINLYLELEKNQETAWIIMKEYVKISLTVENPQAIPISKYLIYRKSPGEEFRVIGEISDFQVQDNSFTFYDQDIEKNKQYSYKIEALDENGLVIGSSQKETI